MEIYSKIIVKLSQIKNQCIKSSVGEIFKSFDDLIGK